MPRSFLVKRRKSDPLDLNPETHEIGKEKSCEVGLLNHQKSLERNDNYPSKNWYIEYHPTMPQVITRKDCTASHHANTRPCYLCHHGNMIRNGCIKYTPIQVPARYNGMCYCMLCQQRPAPMACNCQSCLSFRFEQTAASVLGTSEKDIPVKPQLCCSSMRCERMSIEHLKYEFCHCAQCMERLSRETRFHNNTHITQSLDRPKIHIIQNNTKDQNNNKSQKETTETKNEANIKCNEPDIKNGDVSPDIEVRTDENCTRHTWISNLRKRKREEMEQVSIFKIIKTEKPIMKTLCKNHVEEKKMEVEKNEEVSYLQVNQSKEEDIDYKDKGLENDTEETNKDKVCVGISGTNVTSCHKNGFDLDEENHVVTDKDNTNKDQNQHGKNTRGRGRRHYNTRLTTTKPRAFETDFVVPATADWKQDKEIYSEISKSRQRSKLNRLLANEHERRRVAQLNSAYQDLRQLIPGYQCDTKLPKIKILRYAINYIAHLDNILEVDSDK